MPCWSASQAASSHAFKSKIYFSKIDFTKISSRLHIVAYTPQNRPSRCQIEILRTPWWSASKDASNHVFISNFDFPNLTWTGHTLYFAATLNNLAVIVLKIQRHGCNHSASPRRMVYSFINSDIVLLSQNSCQTDHIHYIESLTPPEIDLADVGSHFWRRHADQRQNTHPTMPSYRKSIFQIWLHQISPKPYTRHLHPMKSTFPTSNRNSEDAIVISVERRFQPCHQIENLFSIVDIEISHTVLAAELKPCCEFRMQIQKTRLEWRRQRASNGIFIHLIWHVLYWAKVVWKWL